MTQVTQVTQVTYEMCISGFGQISPLGNGRSVFRQGILSHSIDGPMDAPTDFSTSGGPVPVETTVQTASGSRTVSHFACSAVELPDALPDAVKRRMPRLSGMFFSAVFEAVEDAFGADQAFLREFPERVGLLVGTAFGALPTAIAYERRLIQDGPIGASPTLFAGSIQNAIAAQLSIALGIRGPTSTVTTMELTTLNVFQMAADWLDQDVVDHVVVAIGDEISEIHLYAMAHQNLLKSTVLLGEGVVSFVLSKTAQATELRQGLKSYPKVASLAPQRPEMPVVTRILCSPSDGSGAALDQLQVCRRMALGVASVADSRQPRDGHGTRIGTHERLYGDTPLGLAFELAAATCLVSEDHVATACVHVHPSGMVDGLLFTAGMIS